MQLLTRPALKRLIVLLSVLAMVVAGCWWIMIRMPLKSFRRTLPPLTAEQMMLRDELRAHVQKPAGDIGERNVFIPVKLRVAVEYIEAAFTNAGFEVARQTFIVDGETCHNLEAEIPGTTHADEIIVIGAHYDSVAGAPGANDNGSGAAALLALAKSPALQKPARTLRFVAFVNEEPPFFQTNGMGSWVYANRCRERDEKIVAMLSLETIGYYRDEKGSQKYPFPLALFYPSRGDFLAFVGNTANASLVRRCIKTFRSQAKFPSEGGALPGALPGVGWSDHWAFWQAGYPAIEITDTAIFRYPHYHQETDTPDKLDYERFARVVDGLEKVIADLTNN